MAGDTSERPRVVIIDFADEQSPSPFVPPRRRGSRPPQHWRLKLQVLDAAHLLSECVESQ